MPTIILKKERGVSSVYNTVCYSKCFSFHGAAVNDILIEAVNRKLNTLHYIPRADKPAFKIDGFHQHYFATLGDMCARHHEADVVVAIIDAMEEFDWTLKFQCDASPIGNGCARTAEHFVFQKAPGTL